MTTGLARLNELRTGRELFRLVGATPKLRRTDTGNGRGAILCPGFGASDASLAPLRRFLRSRNHDARGWGAGRNGGNIRRYLGEMIARAEDFAAETGRPVNMIGWSLGGVYALEVARDRPDLVHKVVHFGTPLQGPRHTVARSSFGEQEIQAIEELIDHRTRRLVTVPVLSMYSRRDGIVDWRTCVNREPGDVRNLEVTSSHIGLGLDPDVWTLISEFLAE
ncbi:MAG: alpha/beta hydrolase [Acidimicrobiia bacterium]|nr:alpha/beta hydrolase [Acidimicrobiia bacterium]